MPMTSQKKERFQKGVLFDSGVRCPASAEALPCAVFGGVWEVILPSLDYNLRNCFLGEPTDYDLRGLEKQVLRGQGPGVRLSQARHAEGCTGIALQKMKEGPGSLFPSRQHHAGGKSGINRRTVSAHQALGLLVNGGQAPAEEAFFFLPCRH